MSSYDREKVDVAVAALRLEGWQTRSASFWHWVTAIRGFTAELVIAERVIVALLPGIDPEAVIAFRRHWVHGNRLMWVMPPWEAE